MGLEHMELDFFILCCASLTVFDKWALASVCTKLRVTLSALFKEWDTYFARNHVAAFALRTVGWNSNSWQMVPYDGILANEDWPTTKMSMPPAMTLRPLRPVFHPFFARLDVSASVYYIFDRGVNDVLEIFPELVDLCFLPLHYDEPWVDECVWTIHGRSMQLKNDKLLRFSGEEQRLWNPIVSTKISTANPRVLFEVMGVVKDTIDLRELLDLVERSADQEWTPCRGSVELLQLGLYVEPPTVTE